LWLLAGVKKFNVLTVGINKNEEQEARKEEKYNLREVRIANHCWGLHPLSLIILKTSRHTGKTVLEMESTFLIFST